MRSSILNRLMQVSGTDRRSRVGNAAFRRRWRNGGGRDVLDRMSLERDVFIARWTREQTELIRMYGCELVETVRWAQRQDFGAKIYLDRDKEECRAFFVIEINIGTQFAIDDLVCSVFAQSSFLKNYDTDVDAVGNPLIFEYPPVDRFRRYPEIPNCIDEPGAVMLAISRDPRRVRGAAAMSELCLDWIYLHEQSHYVLGHLDLLGLKRKELAISETFEAGLVGVRRSSIDSRLRRIMEHQADSYALELLFLSYLAPTRSVRTAFEARYVALGLDIHAALDSEPDLVAFQRVVRVLIVAAAIVALLIERCNEIDGPGEHHPLPSGRILSLILNGANLFQEFAEHLLALRAKQMPSEDQMTRIVVTLIYQCIVDVFLSAMVLGIEDRALRYDFRSGDALDTDFSEDVFRLFGSEKVARGVARTLATAGAKEFAELQPHSDKVYARLRSLHHGGALLDDRW